MTAASGVALQGEEQELARAEAQAVLAAATDPAVRDELLRLLSGVDEGELDADQARSLERVLELALQAGRIRALYGPGGEQALLRLYRRLPAGSALGASARAVTDALAALRGKPIDQARIEAVGPGSFTLSLVADGIELSVRLDRQGARLASVGV